MYSKKSVGLRISERAIMGERDIAGEKELLHMVCKELLQGILCMLDGTFGA